jgi:uncharacterized protein YqhQ
MFEVIAGIGVLGLLIWGGLKLYRRMVLKKIEDESLEIARKQLEEAEQIDIDLTTMSESDIDNEL